MGVISPKRLYSKDFDFVLQALIRYYNRRPDEYGLMDRPQSIYEEYADFIEKFVPHKNSTILDIGSGSWRIPETIAKRNYNKVFGLDFFSDEKLIEYNSKITVSNVELVAYKDSNIPFPDSSFDCITSLCVFEHIVYLEEMLNEVDRVLKPGGKAIFICPNWSGINVGIMGTIALLLGKKYWRFTNILQPIFWIFRSIKWYWEAKFSHKAKFIMIFPEMKGNEIDFQASDFDAVNLCQPISYRKWFNQKGYSTLMYNRGSGTTSYSKIFNRLFPSMATTNELVFEKRK